MGGKDFQGNRRRHKKWIRNQEKSQNLAGQYEKVLKSQGQGIPRILPED